MTLSDDDRAQIRARAEAATSQLPNSGWAAWRQRVADERPLHGMGPSRYLPGDVQHLVSPLVGMLRLMERDGEVPDAEDVTHLIDRLAFVLDIAREDDAHIAGMDPATTLALLDERDNLAAEVERLRMRIAQGWDEGYEAAYQMARCWGHVDYWEGEPENPYAALRGEAR